MGLPITANNTYFKSVTLIWISFCPVLRSYWAFGSVIYNSDIEKWIRKPFSVFHMDSKLYICKLSSIKTFFNSPDFRVISSFTQFELRSIYRQFLLIIQCSILLAWYFIGCIFEWVDGVRVGFKTISAKLKLESGHGPARNIVCGNLRSQEAEDFFRPCQTYHWCSSTLHAG